jgi:protein phosphatase
MDQAESKAVIRRLDVEAGRRILVVSDIHGNLPYLQGVLRKAGFCKNDVLIVDGDFLERGVACLDTMHCLMELSKAGNVQVVSGNRDSWHEVFLLSPEEDDRLLKGYIQLRKTGLLWEMCLRSGIAPEQLEHFTDTKRFLREHYAEEWHFLAGLPHAIETEKFIFAHAGVDPSVPLEENSVETLTHTDAFLLRGWSFPKWVIVGHWPVMLYRENIVSAQPVIDRERKIASIDGGCVLKDDGQLNCLIIPDRECDEFELVSYDSFPLRRVKDPQKGGGRSYYIRWGDSRVQVLERNGEFSRCRHLRTGYEMDILTKYLFSGDEVTECNDCTDYVLPLEPGDEVSVVETTGRGFFVKHNGVSGWYFGELE